MANVRRKKVLLGLILLLTVCARAQFALLPTSARSAALGGAYCEPQQAEHVAMNVGYRAEYGLKELATKSIDATITAPTHTKVHLAYTHFGDTAYHEQTIATGVDIRLTRRTDIEGTLHLFSIGSNSPRYNGERYPTFAIAARSNPVEHTNVRLYCLYAPWLDRQRFCIRATMAYEPTTTTTTYIEWEQYIVGRLHFGCEYKLLENLHLRAGLQTSPMQYSIGVGWRREAFAIDIAVLTHNTLGLTSQLSATLCL